MKKNEEDVSPRYLFELSESLCTCWYSETALIPKEVIRNIFIGQKEKQRCDIVVTLEGVDWLL